MSNGIRLLAAAVLPLAFIVLDGWLYYGLGWRYGQWLGLVSLIGPTCLGAFLIARGGWPTSTKIVLIIPYLVAMLTLVVLLAMYIGCAYGGDCPQS